MIQNPFTYLALLCVIPCAALSASSQETSQEVSEVSSRRSQIEVESDIAAIDSIWHSFMASVMAGDIAGAVQYFNPIERDGAAKKFELMGTFFRESPSTWSDFTPISISDDVARYTYTQTEDDGKRTYEVYFVRHPNLGWLLSKL